MKLSELFEAVKKYDGTGTIEKGLSWKEAMKIARRPSRDCRGFTYNPKTGKYKWL